MMNSQPMRRHVLPPVGSMVGVKRALVRVSKDLQVRIHKEFFYRNHSLHGPNSNDIHRVPFCLTLVFVSILLCQGVGHFP